MKRLLLTNLLKNPSTANIAAAARLYTRVIWWSEIDKVFIGSLPEIDGPCTQAETAEKCAQQLQECAEIAITDFINEGIPLNHPQSCTILAPSKFYKSQNSSSLIAQLRHRLELSQADFAAVLGVTKSTLYQWESGRRNPDGASARLLSIIDKHPELIKESAF